MADIQFSNVRKVYSGDVVAVHDFNLDIKDNEFVVFVGPSGCGKSTTLRMLAGLEEISSGEISINGKVVNDLQPKDRDIAMVFQNYALYPHMSVYKNMSFGLELRKIPKDEIEKKVTEAARILDIEHLLNRKPKALSGGQRQRVALGRAMVRNSSVFLLDEPLSNLDAKLRNQMRAEITKLHKKIKTTFIYVTHDQVEAMTMGDRIVVMKDGYIQQVDTPQNLYNKPCNKFVAGFIGAPQMNFFEVYIRKQDEEYFVDFNEQLFNIPKNIFSDEKLSSYVDSKVILGLRPESIHRSSSSMFAKESSLQVKVDFVELMGSDVHLHLTCNDYTLVAKLPQRYTASYGECIEISIDLNKIHLFNLDSLEVI